MHRSVLAFAIGVAWASPGLFIAPRSAMAAVSALEWQQTSDVTSAVQRRQTGPSGSGITHAELVERVGQSGLTRAQAHNRLTQLGYDPALVDPYFDALEGRAEPPRGQAPESTVEALSKIGVPVTPGDEQDAAPRSAAENPAPDSSEVDPPDIDSPAPESEIFGRSIFELGTTEFSPSSSGPVDPDYRLGPGDELMLVVTGDVELNYTLPVRREGFVVIPDVGQVWVNGLTLAQLEDRLFDRLGSVYSGVRRGADATTHFQISLGKLRVNRVYVIGEVERPSAYQVSASATVFEALYQAGGPNRNGSFRAIEVHRAGKRLATVDLYEYLLHGRSRTDIRLEHGDRIFVPTYDRRITVRGAARRPAMYELVAGEDLRDVISFAGGLSAEAVVRRVQIDRILPPERRRPGVERVLIDVDVSRLADTESKPPELRDGDVVEIFGVSGDRRNRVVLTGEVRRPGIYEWSPGLTLRELIDRADGLAETAYMPRAHVYRLVETDGSLRVISTPLLSDTTETAALDLELGDRDSVAVYSRSALRNEAFVTISGFVKRSGRYALAEGMTIQDLILAAGGFTEGAEMREAEVSRLPDGLTRTDTTAVVLRVPLESSSPELARSEGDRVGVKAVAPDDGDRSMVPDWAPDSTEYALRAGDHVFIRKAVGYEPPRMVTVSGDVLVPGSYVLETREERIASVIRRAGGLTAEAYAPGLQLFRDGKLVATDLAAAMQDPESRYNLVLQPNDSLHIPEYNPTVLVTGAVAFETLVLHEPGKSLEHYVGRAGGYLEVADKKRITVTYQDGERATMERVLWFRNAPHVQPGSTIHVPAKPPSELGGFDLDRFLTRATGILTSVLTLWFAIDKIGESR